MSPLQISNEHEPTCLS